MNEHRDLKINHYSLSRRRNAFSAAQAASAAMPLSTACPGSPLPGQTRMSCQRAIVIDPTTTTARRLRCRARDHRRRRRGPARCGVIGMAANSSEAFEPATAVATQPDGLATASMVLGMAAFLPIPGPAAGLIAIIVGIASGRTDNEGRRMRHRHATIGITLGAASVALLATVCLVFSDTRFRISAATTLAAPRRRLRLLTVLGTLPLGAGYYLSCGRAEQRCVTTTR